MYSALKHQGQPLYKLARAGQEVERRPRSVTIHALELLDWKPPVMKFRVHCSKGTYIRTLAQDIAQALESCAHLKTLRRLDVEPFREQDMVGLQALEERVQDDSWEECLLAVDAGLSAWPTVEIDESAAIRFHNGNPVESPAESSGLVRVYGPEGKLLGIGEVDDHSLLKPRRIMLL